MSFRLSVYRGFQRIFIKNLFKIKKNNLSIESRSQLLNLKFDSNHSVNRFWFHAASAGELESLWPLIVASHEQGEDFIVTVFSHSAMSSLRRLEHEIQNRKGARNLLYCGFSPWEGDWQKVIERVQPNAFITAKYEAWPELWCALSQLKIPLFIVGAKARSSLVFAKQACSWLGFSPPQLVLIPGAQHESLPLQKIYPSALIQVYPDPRWDRVWMRSECGNARASEVLQEFSHLPRPWGMLGQVWLSDLKVWDQLLVQAKGTLWIIPHRLDEKTIREIKEYLQTRGEDTSRCVLIAEAGFLAELYSAADWVYVGGGFGEGVHNTMEPAIHGVPIAIGPQGHKLFSEIEFLRDHGQVTVIQDSISLNNWHQNLNHITTAGRQQWKVRAKELRGGTDKIISLIRSNCLKMHDNFRENSPLRKVGAPHANKNK